MPPDKSIPYHYIHDHFSPSWRTLTRFFSIIPFRTLPQVPAMTSRENDSRRSVVDDALSRAATTGGVAAGDETGSSSSRTVHRQFRTPLGSFPVDRVCHGLPLVPLAPVHRPKPFFDPVFKRMV